MWFVVTAIKLFPQYSIRMDMMKMKMICGILVYVQIARQLCM